MAKRNNDSSPASDYIDQLHWQARHSRRTPVRFEPKWKYKIVYRYPPTAGLDRALGVALLIGIIFVAGWFLLSDVLILGEKIFFGSILGLILLIIFFAVKDASKDTDKKLDD